MSVTTVKTTNAIAISRVLKAHGFQKSATGTTMVRGYHYSSEGFEVVNTNNYVQVSYNLGSSASFSRNWASLNERRMTATTAMFNYLVSKNYKVSMTERGVILVSKAGA